VILTRQTCGQRSSIYVCGGKHRALTPYFSIRICMSSGSKCRGESDLGLCTTSGLTNKSSCAELTSDEKTWLDAKFSGRRMRSIQPHLNWVFATQQRENERPQVEKLEKTRHWKLSRTPTPTGIVVLREETTQVFYLLYSGKAHCNKQDYLAFGESALD